MVGQVTTTLVPLTELLVYQVNIHMYTPRLHIYIYRPKSLDIIPSQGCNNNPYLYVFMCVCVCMCIGFRQIDNNRSASNDVRSMGRTNASNLRDLDPDDSANSLSVNP